MLSILDARSPYRHRQRDAHPPIMIYGCVFNSWLVSSLVLWIYIFVTANGWNLSGGVRDKFFGE